jgi:triacylglycerol esterase/lipase EstA (alpha/beta hydrolase family)
MNVRRRIAVAAATAALAVPLAVATPAQAAAPALRVTKADVLKALTCKGDLATSERQPVLFLHGTTSNSKANWSWNWNRALRQQGPADHWAYCDLDSPESGNEDIQVAGEYVVRAIRIMHHRAGRDIDLVGHSQGGMVGRWALKYWPDTRGMVDDYVGLSSSNHGTTVFQGQCSTTQSCSAANWQQQADSNFLAALNAGQETYDEIDYTEISTQDDEVVVPSTSPYLTEGPNVTNVSVQELCPTETVDHFAMAYSNAAWLIGLDALTHRGPAVLDRVDASTCGAPYMPGVDPAAFPTNVAAALEQTASSSASAPMYAQEPRLRCYARPACD